MRTPTKVIVKVLDLSKELVECRRYYNQTKHPHQLVARELTPRRKWGYVETPKGVYMLTDEGVGSSVPVAPGSPVAIRLFADHQGEFDLVPKAVLTYERGEDIRNLPVAATMNLEQFIRPEGNQTDVNYEMWRDLLEKALG